MLQPTALGLQLDGLLTTSFPALVSEEYTAGMEEELDRIERRVAELREETDLQVSLHSERETTKLIQLVLDVHQALGIRRAETDAELPEMARPLDPEQLREDTERLLREADE